MDSTEHFSDSPLESEPSFIPNAEDVLILMHRDAHFAGSFSVMIDYYVREGKGVSQEFDVARIHELADYEARTKVNLAPLLLSGADAEKINRVRESYQSLKALYDNENSAHIKSRLIADLIFSEEEEPTEEMDAIIAQKESIVPLLIDLLRSEDFHDPLFPGYGQAPILAAKCLGRIGDKRALISLFESIGEEDFFSEDNILDALKNIGEPAKKFLLKILTSEPINFDNERAAIALLRFQGDPEIATSSLKMLLNPKVWKDPAFAAHLILACEGLTDTHEQEQFRSLIQEPTFPKMLLPDLKAINATFPKQV